MLPEMTPKIMRCLAVNAPRLGFHPLNINMAAIAVKIAKITMTGWVGRPMFSQVPAEQTGS